MSLFLCNTGRRNILKTGLKFIAYVFFFLLLRIIIVCFKELFSLNVIDQAFNDMFKSNEVQKVVNTDELTFAQLTVPCGNLSHYDALVLVHSPADSFHRRHEYRTIYGNRDVTKPRHVKLVFLLGLVQDKDLQAQIASEHHMFKDIIQGSFLDGPENLILKSITGFRWVEELCQVVNVVIKIDDDVLVDFPRLFDELWPPTSSYREMIHCKVLRHAKTPRVGEWGALSIKDWPSTVLPDHCFGSMKIIPFTLAGELYQSARFMPHFGSEDLFIYGVVREHTKLIQLIDIDAIEHEHEVYERCRYKFQGRCRSYVIRLPKDQPFVNTFFTFIGPFGSV